MPCCCGMLLCANPWAHLCSCAADMPRSDTMKAHKAECALSAVSPRDGAAFALLIDDLWPCLCREFLKAYCLQLGIMANHQNGRDTHVRGIKVFAPQQDALQPLHQEVGFSTVGFSQYATVR